MDCEDMDRLAAKLLITGVLRLLSARWLLERPSSWILRRCQDLPADAFVPSGQALRAYQRGEDEYGPLSVCALSYCWLTQAHPDPVRTHLEVLRSYLRIHLNLLGPEDDVCVFWDFASLPQNGQNGEPRTPAEMEVFMKGLKAINLLFGSKKVMVLQIKDVPTSLGGNSIVRPEQAFNSLSLRGTELNTAPYSTRGWCFFEDSVASVLKDRQSFLDLSCIRRGEWSEYERYDEASSESVPDVCGSFASATGFFSETKEERERRLEEEQSTSARKAKAAKGHAVWLRLCNSCAALRPPPLHPDVFAQLLSEKVFSIDTDRSLLVNKYRDFFAVYCRRSVYLDFSNRAKGHGWSLAELNNLAWALPEFRNCRSLDLGMHSMGDDGIASIAQALEQLPQLEEIFLDGSVFEQAGLDALCESLSSLLHFRRLVLSSHHEKLRIGWRHRALVKHVEFASFDRRGWDLKRSSIVGKEKKSSEESPLGWCRVDQVCAGCVAGGCCGCRDCCDKHPKLRALNAVLHGCTAEQPIRKSSNDFDSFKEPPPSPCQRECSALTLRSGKPEQHLPLPLPAPPCESLLKSPSAPAAVFLGDSAMEVASERPYESYDSILSEDRHCHRRMQVQSASQITLRTTHSVNKHVMRIAQAEYKSETSDGLLGIREEVSEVAMEICEVGPADADARRKLVPTNHLRDKLVNIVAWICQPSAKNQAC